MLQQSYSCSYSCSPVYFQKPFKFWSDLWSELCSRSCASQKVKKLKVFQKLFVIFKDLCVLRHWISAAICIFQTSLSSPRNICERLIMRSKPVVLRSFYIYPYILFFLSTSLFLHYIRTTLSLFKPVCSSLTLHNANDNSQLPGSFPKQEKSELLSTAKKKNNGQRQNTQTHVLRTVGFLLFLLYRKSLLVMWPSNAVTAPSKLLLHHVL